MPALTARKTFKYKLSPTPAQVVQLEAIVRVCRELYNAALQSGGMPGACSRCRLATTSRRPNCQRYASFGKTAQRFTPKSCRM